MMGVAVTTSSNVAIPTVDGEEPEDAGPVDGEPVDGPEDAEAEASIRVGAI